jgi:hypothetical protein
MAEPEPYLAALWWRHPEGVVWRYVNSVHLEDTALFPAGAPLADKKAYLESIAARWRAEDPGAGAAVTYWGDGPVMTPDGPAPRQARGGVAAAAGLG